MLLPTLDALLALRTRHVYRLAQLIAVPAVALCVGYGFWTAAIVLMLAAILAQLAVLEQALGERS